MYREHMVVTFKPAQRVSRVFSFLRFGVYTSNSLQHLCAKYKVPKAWHQALGHQVFATKCYICRGQSQTKEHIHCHNGHKTSSAYSVWHTPECLQCVQSKPFASCTQLTPSTHGIFCIQLTQVYNVSILRHVYIRINMFHLDTMLTMCAVIAECTW